MPDSKPCNIFSFDNQIFWPKFIAVGISVCHFHYAAVLMRWFRILMMLELCAHVRSICIVISRVDNFMETLIAIPAHLQDYDVCCSGFTPRWLSEMIMVTAGGAIMYSIYRLMDALDVQDESVVS